MAKLIYTGLTSADGYVADPAGTFEWAAPDAEVHAFVNDLERSAGTHLLGRRTYELLSFWDTADAQPDLSPVEREFTRLWLAADKIVYSATLEEPITVRTRIESSFDPEAVRRLKQAADRDLSIGGPTLAAHAIRAGLVDEYHQFLNPLVVGGGIPFWPPGVRLDLELVDQRRFAAGVVYLRYLPRG